METKYLNIDGVEVDEINEMFTDLIASTGTDAAIGVMRDSFIISDEDDQQITKQPKLMLEHDYTSDEQATLDQEVTPQIEDILLKAVYSHSLQERTANTKYALQREQAVRGEQVDRFIFNKFLDLVEITGESLTRALHVNRLKEFMDVKYKRNGRYYDRFNAFLKTERYSRMSKGQKAWCWDMYKNTLAWMKEDFQATKQAYVSCKGQLSVLWDRYNEAKANQDQFIQDVSWWYGYDATAKLWAWYNQAKDFELNTYLTNGNREDEQDERIIQTPLFTGVVAGKTIVARDYSELNAYWDELADQEEAELSAPESEGPGFWDWSYIKKLAADNRKKYSSKAFVSKEDSDSLDAFVDFMVA